VRPPELTTEKQPTLNPDLIILLTVIFQYSTQQFKVGEQLAERLSLPSFLIAGR
jgi:hypothetical protein